MMLNNFATKTLGEIAKISTGDSAPQKSEQFTHKGNGIPFVRMQDLGRFKRTTNLSEIKDCIEEQTSKKLKVFPVGSILIPKSGASIRLNHRAILGVNAHVVSHLAIIQANPLIVLNKYLYFWLCTIDFSQKAHEADMPSLKTSDIAKISVPLPSLQVQQDIVCNLEEVEEIRQYQKSAINKLDGFFEYLLYSSFPSNL